MESTVATFEKITTTVQLLFLMDAKDTTLRSIYEKKFLPPLEFKFKRNEVSRNTAVISLQSNDLVSFIKTYKKQFCNK